MGHMKNLYITIYGGGVVAAAAACELAGLVRERQAYEDVMKSTGDITDIVTVLRGVGFSSVSPEAGDSASLLHYCVTHAADEIEHLRNERRWIAASERLPADGAVVLAWSGKRVVFGYARDGQWIDTLYGWVIPDGPTHWMPLPEPPEVK